MSIFVKSPQHTTEEQQAVSVRVGQWIDRCGTVFDVLSIIDTEEGKQLIRDLLKQTEATIPSLALDQPTCKMVACINHSFEQWVNISVTKNMKKMGIEDEDSDQFSEALVGMVTTLQGDAEFQEQEAKFLAIVKFFNQTFDELYPTRAGLFSVIYARAVEIHNHMMARHNDQQRLRDMFESIVEGMDADDDMTIDGPDTEQTPTRVLQ
jgi:hypothetical protein